MSARTITTTIGAWLTPYSAPMDLLRADSKDVIANLAWSANEMGSSGWARVGTAEVTLQLDDEKQILERQVESLRAEQTKTRADAQARVTELERQIQLLLALEHMPGSAL